LVSRNSKVPSKEGSYNQKDVDRDANKGKRPAFLARWGRLAYHGQKNTGANDALYKSANMGEVIYPRQKANRQ